MYDGDSLAGTYRFLERLNRALLEGRLNRELYVVAVVLLHIESFV